MTVVVKMEETDNESAGFAAHPAVDSTTVSSSISSTSTPPIFPLQCPVLYYSQSSSLVTMGRVVSMQPNGNYEIKVLRQVIRDVPPAELQFAPGCSVLVLPWKKSSKWKRAQVLGSYQKEDTLECFYSVTEHASIKRLVHHGIPLERIRYDEGKEITAENETPEMHPTEEASAKPVSTGEIEAPRECLPTSSEASSEVASPPKPAALESARYISVQEREADAHEMEALDNNNDWQHIEPRSSPPVLAKKPKASPPPRRISMDTFVGEQQHAADAQSHKEAPTSTVDMQSPSHVHGGTMPPPQESNKIEAREGHDGKESLNHIASTSISTTCPQAEKVDTTRSPSRSVLSRLTKPASNKVATPPLAATTAKIPRKCKSGVAQGQSSPGAQYRKEGHWADGEFTQSLPVPNPSPRQGARTVGTLARSVQQDSKKVPSSPLSETHSPPTEQTAQPASEGSSEANPDKNATNVLPNLVTPDKERELISCNPDKEDSLVLDADTNPHIPIKKRPYSDEGMVSSQDKLESLTLKRARGAEMEDTHHAVLQQPQYQPHEWYTTTHTITIPSWLDSAAATGCLIGERGRIHKCIQQTLRCRIVITKHGNPCRIKIMGKSNEHVLSVVREVENKLLTIVPRKGHALFMYEMAYTNGYGERYRNLVQQRSPLNMNNNVWMCRVSFPYNFKQFHGLFVGKRGSGLHPIVKETNCAVDIVEHGGEPCCVVYGGDYRRVQQCVKMVEDRLAFAERVSYNQYH